VLVAFVNLYSEGISFLVLFFAVDKAVRKRTSEIYRGDGESDTKRTRIEKRYSENSGDVSECDKGSGNVLGKGTDEETDNTTRVKRHETEGKAFSENGETVSVVGKESGVSIEDSEKDKEISGVEKEMTDKDTSKDSEVVNSSIKRAHEPVGLIEVKKVRISPEVEKQLKLSEGKTNSAEKPVESASVADSKSNLDLAIERVAKGLAEKSAKKSSEPSRKLNPMPFMRDLHRNMLKKLSRNVSSLA
jgi:hypothetical protein